MSANTLITVKKKSLFEEKPWKTFQPFFGTPDNLFMYEQAAYEIAKAQNWTERQLRDFRDRMLGDIDAKKLPIRSRSTSMTAQPGWDEQVYLVTIEDVNKWLETDGVTYRWQRLVIQARPLEVPPWLRDLPPHAGVTYTDNVGGGRSITGPVYAKDVIEILEATMKRQATGFFTLNEAAQILADMKGADVKGLKQKMLLAFQAGLLPIRDPSDNGKLICTDRVRDFYNLVTIEDLDTWLSSAGMGYQFPKGDELQKSEVAVSTEQRPIQRALAQNTAILEAIEVSGYNAHSLPKSKPGKSGVKASIRAAVATNPLFQGKVFDKAWERLRSSGEIKDAT